MLACPEDITPIRPAGATYRARLSITRMGLSALVTMRWTNSSVETAPIVCVGPWLVVPALTNSLSDSRSRQRFAPTRNTDVKGPGSDVAFELVGQVVQFRPGAFAADRDDDAPHLYPGTRPPWHGRDLAMRR